MLPNGAAAPDFRRPDSVGSTRPLKNIADAKLLVVIFTCFGFLKTCLAGLTIMQCIHVFS
jgi:hypothetical protein